MLPMQQAVAVLIISSAAAVSIHGPARPALSLRCDPWRCLPPLAVDAPPAGTSTPVSPLAEDIWDLSPYTRVQGSTLKTWDIGDEAVNRVQLSIRSDGRPVDSNIELWHTPAYIPYKFRVYTEDGRLRPVDAIIETPKHPKTVAVYNKASVDFPFDANVANTGLDKAYKSLAGVEPELVQGGRITAYSFGPEVESVQVLLMSEAVGGRNIKAKIELTQGPNQVKQVIELYASSGYKNPAYFVIQTPGPENAIRVLNQNTVEFPFDAWVLPYETTSESDNRPQMGPF